MEAGGQSFSSVPTSMGMTITLLTAPVRLAALQSGLL